MTSCLLTRKDYHACVIDDVPARYALFAVGLDLEDDAVALVAIVAGCDRGTHSSVK